jgi:hypothetical protein
MNALSSTSMMLVRGEQLPPMNNKAIEILQRERQRILDAVQKEVEEIDRTIASLRASDSIGGSKTPKHTTPVRRGQYEGMQIKEALQAYLNDRDGGPVSIKQAAIDLAVAGVKLGKPDRHERNIKITISNNNRRFQLDESDNSVSLV